MRICKKNYYAYNIDCKVNISVTNCPVAMNPFFTPNDVWRHYVGVQLDEGISENVLRVTCPLRRPCLFWWRHTDLPLGVVVSVCKPVYHNQQLQGVAAIDLRLADLLSDVTYYSNGDNTYAFIIDNTGTTLHHPLLPNPSTSEMVDRAIVSISFLEPTADQQHIIRSMRK